MVKAWAHSHATLVFAVPENKSDEALVKQGSIGLGINFDEGVITELEQSPQSKVFFNKERIEGKLTQTVLKLFDQRSDTSSNFKITHYSNFPSGYGLSTSGAGSISLVLALNEYHKTNYNYIELLQIAHEAEIICKTGLGSVLGQSVAGIELRKTMGAPGIGEVISIPSNETIFVCPIAPLSTSSVITNKNQMDRVTIMGTEMMQYIDNNMTVYEVLEIGKRFALSSGLLPKQIKQHLFKLEDLGEIHASMAMIGETLIIKARNEKTVEEYIVENRLPFIKTKISSTIPHVLKD
jgi:pantoate kinase